MVTAARAAGAALRPALVARRVMRLFHLGDAYSQVALWIDRRRPAVQIDDWSAPLMAWPASAHVRTPPACPDDSPGVAPAVQASPSLHATTGAHDNSILRCLLATPRLDDGGMEEVVAFLARRLPVCGWETAVLCTSSEAIADGQLTGRTARILQSQGVEVVGFGARQALGWAEGWRPHVVSAHGAPAWAFILAGQLGVPYVDYLHSLNGTMGRDWRWHSEGVRSGSLAGVVAVSDLLRQQQLAANPAFPPDRIVTIPNAVDDERFRGADRAAARDWLGITDQYVFVSLGRHSMEKNGYGLITAFGDLARSRPEAHLVIAGKISDPRYYRQVLQLRDTMPCRERIHLRDHISTPAQLLAAADGFVLNSFFEGGPLVSMEAMCAGLPVIVSDVGAAREQVAGKPARGVVVGNPLGDPLRVDWASSAAAQYRPQVNREELVAAMEFLVANRNDYLHNRDRLAAESAVRFSSASWLAKHAAVLRAAATGAALPDTGRASREVLETC